MLVKTLDKEKVLMIIFFSKKNFEGSFLISRQGKREERNNVKLRGTRLNYEVENKRN